MSPLVLLWPLLLGNYPVKTISWRNGLVSVLNHDPRRGVILFNTSQRLQTQFFQINRIKKKKKIQHRKCQFKMASNKRFVCHVIKTVYIFSTINPCKFYQGTMPHSKILGHNTYFKKYKIFSQNCILRKLKTVS